MNKTTIIQGHRIAPKDIELIKKLIDTNLSWRRTRLSKELCVLWDHRSANGNLKDMAYDSSGRPLACLLFGSAAWASGSRDDFIGWDRDHRSKNLSLTTNNTGFLILPWVRVEHLASHILSKVCQRIKDDWTAKYDHPLYLLETFVERDRFKGTCYKASNWTHVGETKGRSRNDRYSTMKVPIKDIYLYPLTKRFRKVLAG